jgi:hypothetical protein
MRPDISQLLQQRVGHELRELRRLGAARRSASVAVAPADRRARLAGPVRLPVIAALRKEAK